MGEKQNQPFQLSFNASLKVDLWEAQVTDSRRGKNTHFPLSDTLRRSVSSRIAGYEDVNDAEPLSQDPTCRLSGSEKVWERGGKLISRLQSFEAKILGREENFAGLATMNRQLIGKAESVGSPQCVVLDLDPAEIMAYGQQEQSAYCGHLESACYHSLLLFNRKGDCPAARLRPGNVYSADGGLVKHARYHGLLLAGSHPTRPLFASMAWRLTALPAPTG